MKFLKGKKTVIFNIITALVATASHLEAIDIAPNSELDSKIINVVLITGNLILRSMTDTPIFKNTK